MAHTWYKRENRVSNSVARTLGELIGIRVGADTLRHCLTSVSAGSTASVTQWRCGGRPTPSVPRGSAPPSLATTLRYSCCSPQQLGNDSGSSSAQRTGPVMPGCWCHSGSGPSYAVIRPTKLRSDAANDRGCLHTRIRRPTARLSSSSLELHSTQLCRIFSCIESQYVSAVSGAS